MNAIQQKHATLKAMETSVLIAWARRCVEQAKGVVDTEAAKVDPARDANGKVLYSASESLWCAEGNVRDAASALAALEADKGVPQTVNVDPADFGTGTFTFDREQKAYDAVRFAARAIAFTTHQKGQHMPDLIDSIEDGMYAGLVRNIGVTDETTTYVRESSLSGEKALAILESLGRAAEFIAGADYFVSEDGDGNEYLTAYGYDEPIAKNTGTTSWVCS